MKKLILLVGPPGSGKSTLAKKYVAEGFTYINQDKQGKGHLQLFEAALKRGEDVIVDRMGFSKAQRDKYKLVAAAEAYWIEIIVLHQPYQVCFDRCMTRQDHETIKDEQAARSALNMFFTKYERVADCEADAVTRIWPEGHKPQAIVCDLDGTLCDVAHRRHFVRRPTGEKKDWQGFFKGMVDDKPNRWCKDLLLRFFGPEMCIVFCSGRPDSWRKETLAWLRHHGVDIGPLYMRPRSDSRQDNIVKEIILDFEILTRFVPYFMIDDRQQVVDMWRERGFTCLQCDSGDF